MQLMSAHKVDLEAYVELLEELHINYRLLMDAIKSQNDPVTICLLFGYVLNYGFALLGLYLFRTFKEFFVLPTLLVVVPLLVANLFIMLSSNVHAKTRVLEKKFWSLIASTTDFGDARVSHLRSMWVKQLDLIGANGGLALKMFGVINVTYAQIIQSVIWTSSIMLFACGMKTR